MGDVFLKSKFLKKFIYLVSVGLVIFLFQGPILVGASSPEAKTVKIGYYENEIFQEGASENAVKSGYAYEYYMKLSEYTGWRYEYVYGSYNDLYQMLIDGDIDFLAGLAYKEEREDLFSYPELHMGVETYNLVKHEDDKSITTDIKSINGHTIGVLDGAVADSLVDYLNTHNINANVVRYNDPTELNAAFGDGAMDLLAVEGEGTNSRIYYEPVLTFGMSNYYICVNKSRPDLLAELNDAQTRLCNDEPFFTTSLRTKYHVGTVSAKALSSIEREWVASNDSLTVGYLNDYLPYSDTNSDGEVSGAVKEILPRIFDAVDVDGISINYIGYDNYDDMIAAINSDVIDVAFPVGGGLYYGEQNGIYQTTPLISINTELVYETVVVNPDTAKFAVNSNNSMQDYYIKTYYPNAEIVYYDGTDECLNAVLNHEVDCTTLNGMRATEKLRNSDYRRLSYRQLSARDSRSIGVRIGNEGLLKILNRGINLLGDGFTESIAYKYTKDLYNYSSFDWMNDHFILLFICYMVIVVVVIVLLVIRIKKLRLQVATLSNSSKNQAYLIENIGTNFKEPINNIFGMSNMALGISDDETLLENSLNAIIKASGQMKSVVDDIVDLDTIDKKSLTLKEDKINVAGFARELESLMSIKADRKGITFSVTLKDIKTKDIIGDKERLTQAIENILDNSIRYTEPGGNIKMQVQEKPCKNVNLAKLVFTITDNGVGMSDEFQKIAFDPFTKEEISADNEGAGLGLTLAQKLIQLMNGTLQLKSKKNQGTEITFTVDFRKNYT